MNGGVFSTGASRILVAVCGLSLLAGLLMAIFQDQLDPTHSSGADSFSRSAIGHLGFRLLLEETGIPVIASRRDSGFKAGYEGLLVVAEPDLTQAPRQRGQIFADMSQEAYTMLLVLPKRQGLTDPLNPSWLATAEPADREKTDLILEALGLEARIVSGEDPTTLIWHDDRMGTPPMIEDLQLLGGDDLEPIIANENGALLSYYFGTNEDNPFSYFDIYILSDPDLLANHGLGKGRNAALALRIIEFLRMPTGMVVIDETLHGHRAASSPLATFFRFPLVFVTLQVLVSALVMMWMAAGRFGAPVAQDSAADKGPDFLINNTADLLANSGHAPFVLRRYFQAAVARISSRLHVDPPASRPAAHDRFVNISRNRCPDFDFDEMETRVTVLEKLKSTRPGEVRETATTIYRWQQEMTNGL